MKPQRIFPLLFLTALFYFCDPAGGEEELLKDPDEIITIDSIESVINPEDFSFRVDTIASGLQNPWGLTFLPNNDLLITERSGEIRIIRNSQLMDTKISGVPEVFATGQGGLFEIKLHPDYASNGWLYISYASRGNGGGNTAVMRARLDRFSLIDQEVIFQAEPYLSGGQHFGGRIEFDDDGYLYISVGERGRRNNAQTLENHAGKIIRLHDDGSIPPDNPYVNDNNVKSEIFTYGNRNPQGMTKHPETGEIWTHEHGPMGGDEINIVKPGTNYGWPIVSYGKNYDGSTISEVPTREGIADPLHYWDPSIAPSGMTFVTSDLFPAWRGNLLVGSLKFEYLARLELNGEEVIHEEKLLEGLGRVRAVIQGPDGLIYLSVERPGMVFKLVPDSK